MKIHHLFDSETYTLTYIVYDETTKDAVIIDPVLNYDPAGSKVSISSFEQTLQYVLDHDLKVHYVLETHAHADHISCARLLSDHKPDVKIAIGRHITKVQETFKAVYNFKDAKTDGSQFDELLDEDTEYSAGSLSFKVLFTPGHTPACCTFLFEDVAFVGDALFMPDFGCGRCDFPGGDAKTLYHSIHEKIYKLPENTRTFTGHDYQPGGRELRFEAPLTEQKETNVQLKENTTENDFVKFRTERDKKLKAPRLLLPSIQINVFGGHLPEPEDNGLRYLKIPLQ